LRKERESTKNEREEWERKERRGEERREMCRVTMH
jgi:hypothetical protein